MGIQGFIQDFFQGGGGGGENVPELESVNFEEILDILRSLTGVFRFKIQLYSNVKYCVLSSQ